MGYFINIGADMLHNLKSLLAEKLPVLKVDETYKSDIDLFLSLANVFEKNNYYKNDIISDISLSGSHMEFSFNGIPVAVFNMASVLTSPSFELSLAGQGLLDLKEDEMTDWCVSHEESPHILIYLELGNANQFESSDCAFAQNAHETNDYRFIINHKGIAI